MFWLKRIDKHHFGIVFHTDPGMGGGGGGAPAAPADPASPAGSAPADPAPAAPAADPASQPAVQPAGPGGGDPAPAPAPAGPAGGQPSLQPTGSVRDVASAPAPSPDTGAQLDPAMAAAALQMQNEGITAADLNEAMQAVASQATGTDPNDVNLDGNLGLVDDDDGQGGGMTREKLQDFVANTMEGVLTRHTETQNAVNQHNTAVASEQGLISKAMQEAGLKYDVLTERVAASIFPQVAERYGAGHPLEGQFKPLDAQGAATLAGRTKEVFASSIASSLIAQAGGSPATPTGGGAPVAQGGPEQPTNPADPNQEHRQVSDLARQVREARQSGGGNYPIPGVTG